MNTKNLLLASLAGGVVITLLANIPILNLINCLLCAGFWLGAILAVWLYKRQSGSVTLGQAVGVGALAGLFAGVLGFLLSFTGLTGARALLESYAQLAPADAGIDPAMAAALAGPASIALNLVGVLTNVVFGVIGGLIGGAIFKTRTPVPPTGA
jgi:hypothetical protein